MEETVILDKIGQPIAPGAFIAYGHALGRCAGIRIGKVLEIRYSDSGWRAEKDQLQIVVWGVDDDWHYIGGPTLCRSRGFLQYPERIIVLDRSLVPATHLALLDPVKEIIKGA